jgi:hypothetical protein
MCQSGHREAGFDVDTLALCRPPFDSFLRPLQPGCMLLVDPSYLSYLAPIKAVVCRGPLRVQTLLPQAPLVIIHPLAPDQLVL